MTKAVEKSDNFLTANNSSFSYKSLVKKSDSAISVPFLPKKYEKNVKKYIQEGSKSEYRSKVFEKIIRYTQEGLKEYCKNKLTEFGYSPISENGFLYAEGDLPIVLIAHMDTVHSKKARDIVYKDHFVTSPQGIGGDDRCGVFSVLEIIKDLKCHVLFTEDEESGCIGARKFAFGDIAKELSGKIHYCIEIDRRGENDAVFYECENYEFQKFIESTGYFKTAYGSFSDICYIAPELDCSAVNLSIGYFNEHTKSEYIDLDIMYNNIKEIKRIIELESEYFEWVEYDYYGDYGWCGYKYSGSKYSASPTKYEERLYQIYWDESSKYEEVWAVSEEEAIGYFLMDYPYLRYDDINFVGEVF